MDEREKLIRRAYDGMTAGDVEAVMAMCHDDVVWDWTRSLAPFAAVYHGREGLKALHGSFMLAAAHLVFAIEGIEAIDEHVIVHVRVDVRGVSGAEGSARSPHILTFDGGLVRRHTLVQERADALALIAEWSRSASERLE